ncbi:MAG TPA: TonB-dependent receptor, partial [Pyrinomonadaceae bacterium]|nr:TonB-dependent receptor [Pyrinomonadaceae bacterium]
MNLFRNYRAQAAGLILTLLLSAVSAFAQATGSLRGQVTDELGGAVVGATITVVDAAGAIKTATTSGEGEFAFNALAPGTYTVRAFATGFAPYESAEVAVAAGARQTLEIRLGVLLEREEVVVAGESPLEATANADAIVLKGKDLDALPDDPEDLAASLQALAGPSAGPNGGQIYIDGFTGGRLPPKEAIREVRVSQNPFNAENDLPGFGRVDILTRPGFDKLRGSASFNFNDESLNSRNVFAPTRESYQSRQYSFSLSGPVVSKKASFFVDFQRREADDNELINAFVLDPSLNATPFIQTVLTPRRNLTFSPRFDYAFNQNHTLIARYSYSRNRDLFGVGGFNLPERAFTTGFDQHLVQLTETAIINPQVINETRFQFTRNRRNQDGNTELPSISVLDTFTAGGAQIFNLNSDTRYELQNYTTATRGAHVMRFGMRLRHIRIDEETRNNFGGSFIFTSLEQYRNAINGIPGALPTQFNISGGNPLAGVSQTDIGLFFQDEWKLRPNFTLTLGLRYENQTNIDSKFNFAPRVFFAWAPGGTSTGTISGPFGGGGAGQPSFVIRGGFGIFYERFGEQGTLNANRFTGDAAGQLQFRLSGEQLGTALDGVNFNADGTVTGIPTIEELMALGLPQNKFLVADNFQAPYGQMAAVQVEKTLPYNFTVFGVLFTYRQRHSPVVRNLNAPLPGTFEFGNPDRPGVRPFGDTGDIYQYESGGTMNDVRMFLGFRNQLRPGFSLFGNYQTGKAESNTDCVFGNLSLCLPADSYNLKADYGRVAFFPRHRFVFGGTLTVPQLKLSVNPFVVASTGQFFNIRTGIDNNGDRVFNDRPAFADEQTPLADLRVTEFGNFDIRPKAGQTIIPRNLGEGPGFFSVNLNFSRTVGFGDLPGAAAAAAPAGAAAPGPAAPAQGGGAGPR